MTSFGGVTLRLREEVEVTPDAVVVGLIGGTLVWQSVELAWSFSSCDRFFYVNWLVWQPLLVTPFSKMRCVEIERDVMQAFFFSLMPALFDCPFPWSR